MFWHGTMSGAEWAWMSVAMLLFWAAVVAGLIWLVRTVGHGSGEPVSLNKPTFVRPSAREILDERYARGELSDEEYRERRNVLSGR